MTKDEKNFGLILTVVLLVISVSPVATLVFSASSSSIELEEFRWNRFPIRVLVNMNQWGTPDYALAIHEALSSWISCIQTFTDSYPDNTMRNIEWNFYVSNVNSTTSYDIFITFVPNEISPYSVGLTTYRWNRATHEPMPPITIDITTYSKSASRLFVKNVVMHELGHALGLGHASSSSATDGPELMYFSSATTRTVYPSTLDLYGLAQLYQDIYKISVQLPSDIPYKTVWPLAYGKVSIITGVENITVAGAGVYRLGTVVTIKAPDSVELDNRTKLTFLDWYLPIINISIPVSISSIVVDGDITIIVNWNYEYYVDLTSIHGGLYYSGWMREGQTLDLSSPSYVSPEDWMAFIGVRYRFKGWNINGRFTPEASLMLSVDGPLTIRYVWEADYTYTIVIFAPLLALVFSLILHRVSRPKKTEANQEIIEKATNSQDLIR